jgi:hypothetical protein
MSTLPRDPDVIVADWLDDGPTELPDGVRRSIVVAARTAPQARAGLAWRIPEMNNYARIALTAGVAVVVVVGGIALLRPGESSGPGGAPSAAPSTEPSVAPSTAPSSPETPISDPGTAHLQAYRSVGSTSMTVTVPPGWGPGNYGGGQVGRLSIDYEPFVAVEEIDNRFTHPCTDHTLVSPAPGPGVDELLDVLASQPGITAGPITDVTIDGYRGKFVELTVATDTTTCGSSDDSFWLWATPVFGHHFAFDSETNRVYALDIDGTRFTFFARIPSGTATEDLATLETIIDSIEIEPGSAASPSP